MGRSPVSQGGFAPGAPQSIAGDEHRAWPFIPTVRAPAPVRHPCSATHIPVQAFFASVSHPVTPAQESTPDIIKHSPPGMPGAWKRYPERNRLWEAGMAVISVLKPQG